MEGLDQAVGWGLSRTAEVQVGQVVAGKGRAWAAEGRGATLQLPAAHPLSPHYLCMQMYDNLQLFESRVSPSSKGSRDGFGSVSGSVLGSMNGSMASNGSGGGGSGSHD